MIKQENNSIFNWVKLNDALEFHKKEEEFCRKTGDAAGLARSYGSQALILNQCGKLSEAMKLLKKEERLCKESGDIEGLSISYNNQAIALEKLGNNDESLVLQQKSKAYSKLLNM